MFMQCCHQSVCLYIYFVQQVSKNDFYYIPSLKLIMNDNDLIVKFFKYLGWILYLGLFITTILFTREAMEKFLSGDTSITYHETNIDLHHPTITMCPHISWVHKLSGEFYRYGISHIITFKIFVTFVIKKVRGGGDVIRF